MKEFISMDPSVSVGEVLSLHQLLERFGCDDLHEQMLAFCDIQQTPSTSKDDSSI